MRLVFAGTPEPAAAVPAGAAGQRATRWSAVVTRPDARAGRGRDAAPQPGRASWPSRPASRCSRRPAPASRSSWSGCARSRPTAARSSPTARWCPRPVLDVPRHGWVNLHFSLLPAWRGAAPVQHALLAGDEVTGATHVPARGGPGHRAGARRRSPSRSGPPTPPATCWAGSRTPAPACSSRTLDGIEDGALRPVPQPADGRQPGAEDHRRRRPGRLDRAGAARRPASSGPARPRPAPGRRCAASGSSSARSRRRRRAARRPASCAGEPGRHRDHGRAARRGPAGGQGRDGRRPTGCAALRPEPGERLA